jgi:hypothetical protein
MERPAPAARSDLLVRAPGFGDRALTRYGNDRVVARPQGLEPIQEFFG